MISQPFENATTASVFINVVCGAVQSVLGHPTDINICFAGTVNGGIWRTRSCRDIIPEWQPLTDDQPNLSIGDMVFDEMDASGNTILAGVGRFSSLGSLGGVSMGMLYTQNALDDEPTWTVLGNAEGEVNFLKNEVQFRDVFVRDDLMLAAAIEAKEPDECCNRGIFRSTNRGRTWTNVLMGTGRALASDPGDPNRFYATLDNVGNCTGRKHRTHGVYTSADLGKTWRPADMSPLKEYNITQGELMNAKLSVVPSSRSSGSQSAGTLPSRVWSGLVKGDPETNSSAFASISYSDNYAKSWIMMDDILTPNGNVTDGLIPEKVVNNIGVEIEQGEEINEDGAKQELFGGQGRMHFSMMGSPRDKETVYVGGDTQLGPFPNFIGAVQYSARLFRGNASVESDMLDNDEIVSPQWEHMTDWNNVTGIPGGGTASGSAPHADSRDFAFRADGNLLNANDGGVAVLTNPSSTDGDWYGICGSMQNFEAHRYVGLGSMLNSVMYSFFPLLKMRGIHVHLLVMFQHSVAYEPYFGNVVYGLQDNGSVISILGEPFSGFMLAGGDGNRPLVDHTSSDELTYFYIGAQFYLFFGRLGLNKTDDTLVAFDQLFLNGTAGFLATVSA